MNHQVLHKIFQDMILIKLMNKNMLELLYLKNLY